jgi:hypothetical protein
VPCPGCLVAVAGVDGLGETTPNPCFASVVTAAVLGGIFTILIAPLLEPLLAPRRAVSRPRSTSSRTLLLRSHRRYRRRR